MGSKFPTYGCSFVQSNALHCILKRLHLSIENLAFSFGRWRPANTQSHRVPNNVCSAHTVCRWKADFTWWKITSAVKPCVGWVFSSCLEAVRCWCSLRVGMVLQTPHDIRSSLGSFSFEGQGVGSLCKAPLPLYEPTPSCLVKAMGLCPVPPQTHPPQAYIFSHTVKLIWKLVGL